MRREERSASVSQFTHLCPLRETLFISLCSLILASSRDQLTEREEKEEEEKRSSDDFSVIQLS